jgi:hypothetical protein
MISVPLNPVTPFSARSLTQHIALNSENVKESGNNDSGIDVNWIIRYDSINQQFETYVWSLDYQKADTNDEDGDGDTSEMVPNPGFGIQGGQGYLVNISSTRHVDFSGYAWSGVLNTLHPDSSWVFMATHKDKQTGLADLNALRTDGGEFAASLVYSAIYSGAGINWVEVAADLSTAIDTAKALRVYELSDTSADAYGTHQALTAGFYAVDLAAGTLTQVVKTDGVWTDDGATPVDVTDFNPGEIAAEVDDESGDTLYYTAITYKDDTIVESDLITAFTSNPFEVGLSTLNGADGTFTVSDLQRAVSGQIKWDQVASRFQIEAGDGVFSADGALVKQALGGLDGPAEAPAEAPSMDVAYNPWAFIVIGQLPQQIADSAGQYKVRVTNLRNDRVLAEDDNLQAEFRLPMVDSLRRAIVRNNDLIQVEITSQGGQSVAKSQFRVGSQELATAYRVVRLDYNPIPDLTRLLQNYPNPFNPETWIPFGLSQSAEVVISIYDVSGQQVRTLPIGFKPSGIYSSAERAIYWDGRNASGESVSSGVYFYRLQAGDYSQTRKMVILK